MRMIGLIGGMSWESSAEYYRLLNEGVRARLGATASARCLLWSFDFAEIEVLQHAGEWSRLTSGWWTPHGGWRRPERTCF